MSDVKFINTLSDIDPVTTALLMDELACSVLEQMDKSGNVCEFAYDDPILGHIEFTETTLKHELQNIEELEEEALYEVDFRSLAESSDYDSVDEEIDDIVDADDGYEHEILSEYIDILIAQEDADNSI